MTVDEAIKQAEYMLNDHNIVGWTVTILTKARYRTGLCNYQKKTLGLSKAYIEHNPDSAVKETILHEISHIIAGPGTGHGQQWKMVAERMGIRTSSKTTAILPPYALTATCIDCERVYKRHRQPPRGQARYCVDCHTKGYATPLIWTRVK